MSTKPFYYYQIFGLCLESDCVLPELLPAESSARPTLRVQSLASGAFSEEPQREIRRWDTRHGQSVRIAAFTSGGYLLRFPQAADFLIAHDCSEIRYYCEQADTGPGFRHALMDQVIPYALAQSGRLIIHSSAVSTPLGAVCLLGASGRGKSTLATAFHAEGMPLMADDSLWLSLEHRGAVCRPAYPGVRLWPDSATELDRAIASQHPLGYVPEKRRCYLSYDAPAALEVEATSVRAILSLRRCQPQGRKFRVRLSRLPNAAATTEVMAHSFLLDIGDRRHLAQALRHAAEVVTSVPVCLAIYPSDLGVLPMVCAEILRSIPPAPGARAPV